MKSIKVLVLAGGSSTEKEISTRSGENIYNALKNAGFDTTILDPANQDFSYDLLKEFDVVYPILHGTQGEDGCIQGILEIFNIPYVGCRVMASALAMNKAMTKKVFQSLNIPCAKGFIASLDLKETLKKIEEIGYPVFLKPVNEGSSVGTLILHNQKEATELLEDHLKKFPHTLVEQLLIGREMTVGVIEFQNKISVLPILELKPKAEFYNFETKYTAGMTEFILPAPLEKNILELIHHHVLMIFKEFDLRDCVRIDLMLTQNGPIYLEINTAPGMTNTSDIPAMLNYTQIPIETFVTQMIHNTQGRNIVYKT